MNRMLAHPRRLAIVAATALSLFSMHPAQADDLPPGARQRHAEMMQKLQPSARSWVIEEGHRYASLHRNNPQRPILDGDLHTRARARFGASVSDTNVEALVFLVLMEASKDAQEDLRKTMDGVKKLNSAKAELAKLSDAVGSEAVRNAQRPNSEPCIQPACGQSLLQARQTAARLQTLGVSYVPPQQLRTVGEMRAFNADVRRNLDSMSEMGEMESLRLQMAMDRMSKMMSTLSNLLKKISDTQAGITQNLK